MQETALAIVDSALNLIGVLGDGTTITPKEYSDSLLQLNRMLDRWNLTDVLIYATNPHTFPLVPGQQSYNLGLTGDFNMARPSRIERISIQYPATSGVLLELPLDQDFDLEHWQSIVVKDIPSAFPVICYNNTGYPFMNLNFWPYPTAPCNVILYTWDMMPIITNLTDIVALPAGYTDAIVYNLAIRLAQLFDRAPSANLIQEARQAKHDINTINAGTPTLHIDGMWSGNRNSSLAAQSIGRVVL